MNYINPHLKLVSSFNIVNISFYYFHNDKSFDIYMYIEIWNHFLYKC